MSYDVPLYDALYDYVKKNKIPFHMPGHKQGAAIPKQFKRDLFKIDLTELEGTDNLHVPEYAIKAAQEKAARAFNSKQAFFLVNGSTCGIQVMIASTCSPGDEIIVDRNCHSSLISAFILCGIVPRYVYSQYINDYGICGGINPRDIEKSLIDYPNAKAVFITYPNYYGICSDIKAISDIVNKHGKMLLVDEAHGAHFYFNDKLPTGALMAGADMCVQSAHKTLPALTQSSFLHINSDKIDIYRLKSCLRMFQTSSPSFILMAYLDIAREIAEKEGKCLLDELIKKTNKIKKHINLFSSARCLTDDLIGNYEIKEMDTTRLTINFSHAGISGFEAARILNAEYGIQVEMADNKNIVCIISLGNTAKEILHLENAVIKVAGTQKKSYSESIQSSYPTTYQNIIPREAFFDKGKFIEITKASGKVCADIIISYPPGVPILCPGEVVTDEIIQYILNVDNSGGLIIGVRDKKFLRIVH